MKPVAIAYSDVHHNIWGTFNKDWKRTKVATVVEHMVFKKAKELKVPVLFVGDLMHNEKALSNDLLSVVLPHYHYLGKYDTEMYGISGNHDQSGINTKEHRSNSYVKTFSKVFDYMHCVDFKTCLINKDKKIMIFGVPYLTHDSGLLEAIKALKPKKYKGKDKRIY